MPKITHTETPMITTTGFLPDETTRQNDEYFRKMQARKQVKREQAIDLLMLLSALESHLLSEGKFIPEYLMVRTATSVALLKEQVLKDD